MNDLEIENQMKINIYQSSNGYKGHLDFLEMHGFITVEEREYGCDVVRDVEENSQNYRKVVVQDLFLEEGILDED